MSTSKLSLRPHQRKVIKFSLKHKKTLNLSVVGSGKTLCGLSLIALLKNKKALILCPAYLRLNWQGEVNKFFPHLKSFVLKNKKDVEIARDYQIVIASYSALDVLEDFFKRPILLVDEAHYLKELKSLRSRYFHNYVAKHKPEYISLMTGTPITKHVPDLFPLMAVVNPLDFLEKYPDFYSFSHHFTHFKKYSMGSFQKIEWESVRNKEEILYYLKACAIRVTLDELGELPEHYTETISLDSSKLSAKKEAELWEAFQKAREDERNLEVFITNKAYSALKKAPQTADFVNDLLVSGESVVVFSDHVEAAKHIHSKVESSSLIIGGMGDEERKKIVDGFQSGRIKCVVGTIGAMGTGITLTAARISVFNDLSWVPAENEQASARIYRMSQTRNCVRYLMAMGEIDKRISKILEKKSAVIDILVKTEKFGGKS